MADHADLAARLDALESRIAYQDDAMETLNATVTAQWKQIDMLTRQFAALRERLAEAEARGPGGPGDERPPHY